jgi:hypothetical protein
MEELDTLNVNHVWLPVSVNKPAAVLANQGLFKLSICTVITELSGKPEFTMV